MERPWMNPALDVERRVELLLQAMTLEECAAQLLQVTIKKVDDAMLKAGLGSVILAGSATAGNDAQEASSGQVCDRLQKVAVEESRLGIPTIFGRDVIHGHHTVFPVPLGQGASWDEELVEGGCRAAACEARPDGIHWTFSPMLDIARDPRWGRIVEGYGESPLLTGNLGAAAVRGYQTDDLTGPTVIAACAKHFVGYGAAEGGRDYNSTEITDSTLADVYLPPFQAVVDAGCQTVMTGFNELNGRPLCGNDKLLTGVLREAWGFDGFVVTDWDAVSELMVHGVAADEKDAAAQALEAGSDMDMLGLCYADNLVALVQEGQLDEAVVRQAVARVLRVKFRLGLFEQPWAETVTPDRAAYQAQARQAVARCAVLLENDGTLPLAPEGGTLAVLGPLVQAKRELFGTWALDGIDEEVVPVIDAVKEQLSPGWRIATADWSDPSMMLHVANASDVILAVVGETHTRTGEANSVADIGLPPGQAEVLEQLVNLGKTVILLVISGRPLALPPVVDRCQAILWSFHPGTQGGPGLVDVITGRQEPGGRLPVTLPRHLGQIPLYHDHKPTGRFLDEYHRQPGDAPTRRGMRYRLLDCPGSPKWPFGYGLTYTSFAMGELQVPSADIESGVHLTTSVTNTGDRAGSTIIQVYLGDPVAEVSQPVRRLVAYHRVELAAGEEMAVEFQLSPAVLGYTHLDGERSLDHGTLIFYVGQFSSAKEQAEVVI